MTYPPSTPQEEAIVHQRRLLQGHPRADARTLRRCVLDNRKKLEAGWNNSLTATQGFGWHPPVTLQLSAVDRDALRRQQEVDRARDRRRREQEAERETALRHALERSAAAEAAAAALLAANKAISGRCDEVGRGELHNPGGRVRTGFAPHQAFAAAGSRLDASDTHLRPSEYLQFDVQQRSDCGNAVQAGAEGVGAGADPFAATPPQDDDDVARGDTTRTDDDSFDFPTFGDGDSDDGGAENGVDGVGDYNSLADSPNAVMDDVGDSSSMDLDGGVDFDDLGGLGNDEAATFDFTLGPTNGIRHDLAAKEPRPTDADGPSFPDLVGASSSESEGEDTDDGRRSVVRRKTRMDGNHRDTGAASDDVTMDCVLSALPKTCEALGLICGEVREYCLENGLLNIKPKKAWDQFQAYIGDADEIGFDGSKILEVGVRRYFHTMVRFDSVLLQRFLHT